jgi:cation:H+ antiporter
MNELLDPLRTALIGHGVLLPLAVFVALGAAVFVTASRLAHHGDAIADATGVGRFWVGTLLLAASTSVPEFVTDINAALLRAVDIGVGDLMGSTLANMLILAALDLFYAKRRILDHVADGHVLVGAIAIVLTTFAAVAIGVGGFGRIGHGGVETIVIVIGYALGMRVVHDRSRADLPPPPEGVAPAHAGALRRAALGFGGTVVVLWLLAPLVVIAADAVAHEAGLSQTLIGTLLVGFTTSFPEIAATIAAVRMGAIDMAVGNIFGSNAFNMTILLAMDLAYTPGPVLADVSPAAVLAAQFAVVALALGIVGIQARSGGRYGLLRIESLLILATYAAGAVVLARAG